MQRGEFGQWNPVMLASLVDHHAADMGLPDGGDTCLHGLHHDCPAGRRPEHVIRRILRKWRLSRLLRVLPALPGGSRRRGWLIWGALRFGRTFRRGGLLRHSRLPMFSSPILVLPTKEVSASTLPTTVVVDALFWARL